MAAALKYEVREFLGHDIRIREDGYANATDMVKVGGKVWSTYLQNKETLKVLQELTRSLGIPRDLLVVSITKGPNSDRGTWVHPRVAIHLAQWISPSFAVNVTGWIHRYLKGDISLAQEIAQRNIELKQDTSEVDELRKQLEAMKLRHDETNAKNLALEQDLKNKTRGFSQIKMYIENIKLREPHQRLYIAFCRLDAAENIFKVGGCASQELLKKRLQSYNTAQANDNKFQYAAVWNVNNFQHAEARIKHLIGEFRQTTSAEVYVMNYESLFKILDHIVSNYNDETNDVNEFIRSVLDNMATKTPVVPEPIILDRIELTRYEDGNVAETKTIDLADMHAAEKRVIIENLLTEFRRGKLRASRHDFYKFIETQGVRRYKKLDLWSELKRICATIADFQMSWK